MIRLLFLLLSFSLVSEELKPLEELLDEVEFDNEATIFVLNKCAGAAFLLSDEEHDTWDKLSKGFLRSAVWFYLEENELFDSERMQKNVDEYYSKFRQEALKFGEEYGQSVRNINPDDFEGKPPAFQVLDDDVTFCLAIAEIEQVKTLTNIDFTNID